MQGHKISAAGKGFPSCRCGGILCCCRTLTAEMCCQHEAKVTEAVRGCRVMQKCWPDLLYQHSLPELSVPGSAPCEGTFQEVSSSCGHKRGRTGVKDHLSFYLLFSQLCHFQTQPTGFLFHLRAVLPLMITLRAHQGKLVPSGLFRGGAAFPRVSRRADGTLRAQVILYTVPLLFTVPII